MEAAVEKWYLESQGYIVPRSPKNSRPAHLR